MGVEFDGILVTVVATKPATNLHLAAVAFRLQPPGSRRSSGQSGPARRLLVERSLDQFPEPLSRHFSISLSAAMAVGMDDQDALTRQARPETSDQTGSGLVLDPARITQIPAQRDTGARRIDVLPAWAARATGQLHDLGPGNPISPGKGQVRIPQSPASLHHFSLQIDPTRRAGVVDSPFRLGLYRSILQ